MVRRRRGIFHKHGRTPYHREDSFRGIRRAARERFEWIDLDLQMTKDGVVVCTHWPRPLLRDGFRDPGPGRKISRFAKVSSLTLAEVQRLRTKDSYRIRTLDECLALCAHLGIGAKVEPKGDPRFKNLQVWQAIKHMAAKHGAHISGYALRRNAGALPYMNAAGIPARRLSH